MPTGVAMRDAREQLFDAAERILVRDGPGALTSRAVTAEAGCAKGVLHRHFADFDAFLAELVQDRIARLGRQDAALREAAGTGTVAGNLTGALIELFGPVARAILPSSPPGTSCAPGCAGPRRSASRCSRRARP
ncbi:TetR/AcrR family transcriptional regulator [Actinomadura yumaensis]|uniref:TetR/AcrR family transcriptional regulator n=1 Tax=Actinomadura yumaensis TaxID=111807 RepID=UPI003614EC0B